jgi:hypothetical protein
MLKLMVGVVVGVLVAWLSRREGALDPIRQRVASAPAPLRERAQSVTSATATGAARLTQVVQSAPVPPLVKSRAQAVLSAVQPGRQSPGKTGESAQSAAETSVSLAAETMIPDEVLAEQDAAARAAQEAQQEKQAGG